MNNILKTAIIAVSISGTISSCTKKLDQLPTNGLSETTVYATPAGYKSAFAKVYGSMALTGNSGAGSGDVAGIDAGTSDFLRLYWKAQELSTDEAVVAWGDPGIQDFHLMNWSSSNPMLTGLFYRLYYQITLANDFIRQSDPAKVAANGIGTMDAEAIKKYRYEARFLRAFQYANLMDLFGNVPFTTEANAIGDTLPSQISRAKLFQYVESELLAIEPNMVASRTNEYGRADMATVQALLARIYLNSVVYTGTVRNDDAAKYAKKVIDAGYTLVNEYKNLMVADNHTNTNEFIFTINYDGLFTQNFGGTTFLTHAPVGGTMKASDFGIGGGWSGLRTTSSIIDKYINLISNSDTRAQFYTDGQTQEINDLTKFTNGYTVTKFKNKTKAGVAGKGDVFVDIDMPIFRLPEMYLIYAEAVKRGSTFGDETTALMYLNKLNERAYGNTSGNKSTYDLTYIIDERARELFWEGFRRTDLIRYNQFVESSYLWPWKGGSKNGTSVDSYRKLYPIPSAEITSNFKIKQNPGY